MGARALPRRFGVILLQYVLSLTFALPLAFAVGDVASRFGDGTIAAPRMASGRDVVVLVDFWVTNRDALIAAGTVAGAFLPLFILAGWFVDGAILATTRDRSSGNFVAEGARVFGRLLRLAPLSFLFAAGVLGPGVAMAYGLSMRMVEPWNDLRAVMAVQLGSVAVLLVVGVWVKGTLEIMRAFAATGEARALCAFRKGLRLGVAYPHVILATIGPWMLAWGLVGVTVTLIDPSLDRSSTQVVVLSLAGHHAAGLARAAFRVGLLGSVAELALEVREVDAASSLDKDGRPGCLRADCQR